MSGSSRSSTAQASGKAANRWGCLIVVVLIVGGLVWALYAAGVFEKDPEPVVGGGLFGTSGSEQLVTRLDAAAKAHGICYGWQVDTDQPTLDPYAGAPAGSTAEPGVDVGSNLGAGVDPRQSPRQCPRWAVLTVDYYYDPVEEEWTRVSTGIESNLPPAAGPSDLVDAGISDQDLLGDQSGARLADAIGAVPMIMVEKGAAQRPVPAAAELSAPAGDKPTAPGIGRYIVMGVAGALIIGGLAWMVTAAVRSRTS
jgi:hypothetical protein